MGFGWTVPTSTYSAHSSTSRCTAANHVSVFARANLVMESSFAHPDPSPCFPCATAKRTARQTYIWLPARLLPSYLGLAWNLIGFCLSCCSCFCSCWLVARVVITTVERKKAEERRSLEGLYMRKSKSHNRRGFGGIQFRI